MLSSSTGEDYVQIPYCIIQEKAEWPTEFLVSKWLCVVGGGVSSLNNKSNFHATYSMCYGLYNLSLTYLKACSTISGTV